MHETHIDSSATFTTFFSLLIWYRPLDFDAYNPGNHDLEVGLELATSCKKAAREFLSKTWQRSTLNSRSAWIKKANRRQHREDDHLVNWWDDTDIHEGENSIGNSTSYLNMTNGTVT